MDKLLGWMDKLLGWIATATAVLGGSVIVAMMVLITVDAVGRKFGHPVPGGLEFSEAMMVVAVYLALMSVQRHRENVFVSLVTRALPPHRQAQLDAVAEMVGAVMFAIFTWIGFEKAIESTAYGEYRVAAMTVLIWPFRWFIPLGLALLCVQLVVMAIQDWMASKSSSGEYLPKV